jgi:hypothetical protein
MRTLVQRLKRLWNTPVEFYGVDRPEPQAGPWHGLLLFVVLLVILGLLWLVRYLPERTYLVQLPSMSPQGRTAVGEIGGGQRRGDTVTSGERGKTADDLARLLTIRAHDRASTARRSPLYTRSAQPATSVTEMLARVGPGATATRSAVDAATAALHRPEAHAGRVLFRGTQRSLPFRHIGWLGQQVLHVMLPTAELPDTKALLDTLARGH